MTQTKKKVNKLAIVSIAFVLALLVMLPVVAMLNTTSAYALLDWNLVDIGKHLDWDGDTEYMDEWNASVDVWEDYKPGVIREDSFWVIEDVKISDYYEESSTMAVTYSGGTIKFNDYHFASMTTGQRQKTMIHEIGHALGLDHNNSDTTSIMCQGKREQTWLSDDDKAGYDAAYELYDEQ